MVNVTTVGEMPAVAVVQTVEQLVDHLVPLMKQGMALPTLVGGDQPQSPLSLF